MLSGFIPKCCVYHLPPNWIMNLLNNMHMAKATLHIKDGNYLPCQCVHELMHIALYYIVS